MHIYVSENSEKRQQEAMAESYRDDIVVEINNDFYPVIVITLERLYREVSECNNKNEIYSMKPNLMIVKEITNDDIIKTIILNIDNLFLWNLKPLALIDSILYLNKQENELYCNINDFICIY